MASLKKIRFIYDGLNQQTRWYTGLSIKRYIKSRILSKYSSNVNRSIESGRWSAYCHFDQTKSLENVVSKYSINNSSTIIVHPLTPQALLDVLIKTGATIKTLDINKTTLSFNSTLLQNSIRQMRIKNQTPDLVVHYDLNGLYNDISKSLSFCSSIAVPSIVIMDNNILNSEFYEVVANLGLGSMIWYSQENFVDEHLREVIDEDFENYPWYFSIHIEDRVTSSLERHLKQSHTVMRELISDYMVLLSYKNKSNSPVEYFMWQFIKFNYIKKGFGVDNARARLLDHYAKLNEYAVPDFLFDLESSFPKNDYLYEYNIEDNDLLMRSRAKQMYDFFSQYLKDNPSAQVEVPSFFLDRSYLGFLFFTTDKNTWENLLDTMGIQYRVMSLNYNSILNQTITPIASFVAAYGILLDLNSVAKNEKVTYTSTNEQ